MHLRALIALLLLLWSPAAFAQGVSWRVTEAAGQVELRRGTQAVAARRGAVLAPGDLVSTGANGRAVLVRGRDFVIVSPGSRLRVPGSTEAGGAQHVRMQQVSGRAQYRIERRSAPHFGVRTPHLVALVKGTVFTVTVGDDSAEVAVSEGRVEVATLNGEMSRMVEPGFAAGVSAADPARLSHGESADARAEMTREAGSDVRGRSEDRRSDEGRGGNGGSSAGHRNDGGRHAGGHDHAPRLEYSPLDGRSGGLTVPGGNGTGQDVGRLRETERRLAETLVQHQPNPGGNNGGGNDGGNNGGGNDGGSTTPLPSVPAPLPPAPLPPAPQPDNSGSGSTPGSGSGSATPPPPSAPPAPPPPPATSGPSDNSGSGSSGSGSGSSGSNSGSGSSGSDSGPGSGAPIPPPPTSEPAPPPPTPTTSEPAPPPPPPTSEPAPPPPPITTSEPAPPPPTTTSEPPPPPPPSTTTAPTTTTTAPTTSTTAPTVTAPPPPTAPTQPTSGTRCLLGLVCL